MRRKLQQQKPIKGCNPQSYHAVTRILSLTAFDLLDFSSIRSLEQMFCTEEKERRICRRDRASEREREREKRDAKEVQQRPPTSPVSENRLPFPPSHPAHPQNKLLPRKLPLTPHNFFKKKKKPKSTYTNNVQVFHQIFKFFFQNKFLILFLGGGGIPL
jgi:hypothetical protein